MVILPEGNAAATSLLVEACCANCEGWLAAACLCRSAVHDSSTVTVLARSRGFIFPEVFRLALVKGIVRIKNVKLRPLIKARERKEKSFLIGRKVSTNQKQKR